MTLTRTHRFIKPPVQLPNRLHIYDTRGPRSLLFANPHRGTIPVILEAFVGLRCSGVRNGIYRELKHYMLCLQYLERMLQLNLLSVSSWSRLPISVHASTPRWANFYPTTNTQPHKQNSISTVIAVIPTPPPSSAPSVHWSHA